MQPQPGLIVIEGCAPDFQVIRLTEVPHVGDSAADEPVRDEAHRDASPETAGGSRPSRAGQVVEPSLAAHELSAFPHVGDPEDGQNRACADVEAALVKLGFRRHEAHEAVARACERVDAPGDLEALLRAALRECPKVS